MSWKVVYFGRFRPMSRPHLDLSQPSIQSVTRLGLLGADRPRAKCRVGRDWVMSSQLCGYLQNASMDKSGLVKLHIGICLHCEVLEMSSFGTHLEGREVIEAYILRATEECGINFYD